ncbi:MAG TPA: hypothetical protein VK540_11035 [Polyangiaceae bacterium]|jgi:hypothetical protein|nr:hypothetical protein [Polyangiaceae bacterium]
MTATVHVLRQIDVGDSIDLERASKTFAQSARRADPSKQPGAGVVLRREPLELTLDPVDIGPFRAELRTRLFDFGVVAIRFTLSVSESSGAALVALASQISEAGPSFDGKAREIWQAMAREMASAIVPWEERDAAPLMEDFTVFALGSVPSGDMDAQAVLAHLLSGEPRDRKLAPAMIQELARRAIRYYDDDLVLVDYDAAVIVDQDDVTALVDIFEVASAQLLELRFYEGMLGRALEKLLQDVRMARTTVWLLRSPFRRIAHRAALLVIELGELSDRLERAITLKGDSYSVQVYREAASRFRLAEADASVKEKVETISRVSEVLGHEIHTRRDLLLEVLVIVLIAFEVLMALRH